MYNPEDHAHQLGLRVVYGDPGPGRNGIYLHDCLTIIIRATLTTRGKRCTLAHEIVHHEYGDEPTTDPVWHAKRETRRDRIATQRLMKNTDPTITAGITDMAEWCRAYDVLPWVITTHLKEKTHAA
ncbi:ImmA/IrrE family metallo-endopeptidase [Rothia koreensis]|uniref:ImmA/IrrE family metallo-endopeptidase n=1 Tax=Rothia koreensis TaxID=592378 RepID=UPI003FCDE1D5